jgi:hypothetical protein
MHMRSTPRRLALPRLALTAAALAAFAGGSVATAAGATHHHHKPQQKKVLALGGKWSGHYSGAFNGTFTLHWTQSGSKLTGSITLSNPSGTYSCNGLINGSGIKFGVVGAGATYTGSVSGSSMSGTYNTPRGGGSWSASKS